MNDKSGGCGKAIANFKTRSGTCLQRLQKPLAELMEILNQICPGCTLEASPLVLI